MPFLLSHIPAIINEVCKYRYEQPWVEFKTNNCNPTMIAENISALANAAALYGQTHGLMIWGVEDKSHEIIGTTFVPQEMKIGNQGLELWIITQLDPNIQFYFHEIEICGKRIVLLEIHAANSTPIRFRSVAYIKIDSYTKKLKDYPDIEKELWSIFTKKSFEMTIAIENVDSDNVLRLLDYPAYFDLLKLELPSNKNGILEALVADGMIYKNNTGSYNITNLGAILFAKKLSEFQSLARKAVRIIKYDGIDRTVNSSEKISEVGYANGFQDLISYINNLLPHNEVIEQALRKSVLMYPELAIREAVANAIIHQNFFVQGTSPMIEIFTNRMEITNPGTPLIDKQRFLDHPPISRNEKLASFLRRIGVCEERGSGFDKIVKQTEIFQLPAPEIEVFENHTRLILFVHKTFKDMDKLERQQACYLHACLKRVNREYMTNASLRERFKIAEKNSSMISRLLNETCESKLIKIVDFSASHKSRKYEPFWS